MAKLSQRQTSKKQKVLQRSNPLVGGTFVSFSLLAGAPALETDVKLGSQLRKSQKKEWGFAPLLLLGFSWTNLLILVP
jgi:hypothetical protein